MNGESSPSTSRSCNVTENEASPGTVATQFPRTGENADWDGVVAALKKLHCNIVMRNELIPNLRWCRTFPRPRCSVEGCYLELPKFLCRLPANFELAFHCIASSHSTIIIQNRLMTKLFNKTVLTKAFLNNKNELKDIPFSVVESFPFHICHRHFICSPQYYLDIFAETKPKPLLFNYLPKQSPNNIHEAGQVRQRAYLLVKLGIVDSKILPEVGIRKEIPYMDQTERVRTCAIEGCSGSVPFEAKNFQMINIPRVWQEFHRWERSVWFGLQRDFCLPSLGCICAQHFTEIVDNPEEQEPPILFHSVKYSLNTNKPSCAIPSCRNNLSSDENLLYLPFPSSPSERSAWVLEVRKHHPNFVLNPKKRVEWICCLHFTDLSSLENAKPTVNLGSNEVEELSIGSSLISQKNYSMSLNPLYVPLMANREEKRRGFKRRCCAETTLIFTKLAKLQEKSLTVFKLIEQLYVLYGLAPLKEDTYFGKSIYGCDGKVLWNRVPKLGMMECPPSLLSEEDQNKGSPMTIADALAGLIAKKS